jgi:uridine kinase
MANSTIITIAGGTASGKTTIAEKIHDIVKQSKSVTLITLDNYYLTGEEAQKHFDGDID